jgi:hypothetical protein
MTSHDPDVSSQWPVSIYLTIIAIAPFCMLALGLAGR